MKSNFFFFFKINLGHSWTGAWIPGSDGCFIELRKKQTTSQWSLDARFGAGGRRSRSSGWCWSSLAESERQCRHAWWWRTCSCSRYVQRNSFLIAFILLSITNYRFNFHPFALSLSILFATISWLVKLITRVITIVSEGKFSPFFGFYPVTGGLAQIGGSTVVVKFSPEERFPAK